MGGLFSGKGTEAKCDCADELAEKYRPFQRHPALFNTSEGWQDEWFDSSFLAALRGRSEDAWNDIVTEHLPGRVFSCMMFSTEFCNMFIEELDNFASTGLRARPPNSMNNYGIVLGDIGWKPMVELLQRQILGKISAKYWRHIAPFDADHTFTVRYKEGEDLGLDMHTDDSDVTFNLCLGKCFTGAGLTFCGKLGEPRHRKQSCVFQHQLGRCVWHLGRQRHGADDIASGERVNLIIWNISSQYRKSREYTKPAYSKEDGPPDAVCLSYTHDKDYGVFKDYSAKTSEFKGRGWCPPRSAEYEGFRLEDAGSCSG
eukprot:TRINITY_DN24727_c0_g1_i1.p1 TRINITY_DN24727_c0_g1~~TRINITY_DN24727_c0_g1_i1.p1  ORF type:complete len:314 (-),score=34.86 TRINITY_DN24727_c0_g1_i1:339-1280(-)